MQPLTVKQGKVSTVIGRFTFSRQKVSDHFKNFNSIRTECTHLMD